MLNVAFCRAANAIFGKVGRISSEEVVLQLVKSKCLPFLLYCLEVCPLTKTDIKSLDFVINRVFMKLFRTSNIVTVKACQLQFTIDLPSVIIEKRAKNLKIVLLKLNTRILTTFEIFGAAGIAQCTLLFTFMI